MKLIQSEDKTLTINVAGAISIDKKGKTTLAVLKEDTPVASAIYLSGRRARALYNLLKKHYEK